MLTIANMWNLTKPNMNTTNCDVWNLSKLVTCLPISIYSTDSFETSTPVHEGLSGVTTQGKKFKNNLPVINKSDYGYRVAAKSAIRRGNLNIQTATPDAPSVFFCVVATAHTLSMVALVGQLNGWLVSVCTSISTPANVTTHLERGNSGGDSLNQTEIIIMMATPIQTRPTFIWLIAAVRRDCPTVTAKIHHIPANSEREARLSLAGDYVCFFAGRIPSARMQGVSHGA